jgi:hypothetical protein
VRREPHLGRPPVAAFSEALEVPVGYFYDGLSEVAPREATVESEGNGEMFARKETLDLIRAYYQLGERPRRRLLDLAKSLNGGEMPLNGGEMLEA